MADSPTEVKAMDSVRDAVNSVKFSKETFPYTRFYVGWETNKIIGKELVQNLALAAACVFLVTLFLLANLWTSLMVFTCVVLTLVRAFLYSTIRCFWVSGSSPTSAKLSLRVRRVGHSLQISGVGITSYI